MKKETKLQLLVAGVVLLAVVIDQVLKIYIRTHFALGEAREITSWFYLCFVENNGMAFGIEWFSKLLLTLFRIAAVVVLGWYANRLIFAEKKGLRTVRAGYLTMVSLVIAGAIGNIIDCVCYGRIFGYAGWMYGKVVDMFYFPLIKNGAGECIFFRPVFNFADSCITVAVIAILIWFSKDLNDSLSKPQTSEKN